MKNESITLEDIIKTIVESRRMLAYFFIIAVVVAFFFYLTTPRSYTAEATIFPIAGSGGSFAEYLAGTGLGMLTQSETKANVILVALNSQTLAESVAGRQDIASSILNKPEKELAPADIGRAGRQLRGIMKFLVTKNGSIGISATFRDRHKVAELVNIYLDELSVFLNRNALNMNFAVIDKAQEPLRPSAPNLMKNMIVSLGIAFFFGLMYIGANVGVLGVSSSRFVSPRQVAS